MNIRVATGGQVLLALDLFVFLWEWGPIYADEGPDPSPHNPRGFSPDRTLEKVQQVYGAKLPTLSHAGLDASGLYHIRNFLRASLDSFLNPSSALHLREDFFCVGTLFNNIVQGSLGAAYPLWVKLFLHVVGHQITEADLKNPTPAGVTV